MADLFQDCLKQNHGRIEETGFHQIHLSTNHLSNKRCCRTVKKRITWAKKTLVSGITKCPSGKNLLSVDPPGGRRTWAGWTQVLQPVIPQPTSFRIYRSLSTGIRVRKLSAFHSGVGTLNDFASSRLFEKLPLGYHSLRARSLTDGDFDHGRRSRGETRVWHVPEAITDHVPTVGTRWVSYQTWNKGKELTSIMFLSSCSM
jgi:hypothetical protein